MNKMTFRIAKNYIFTCSIVNALMFSVAICYYRQTTMHARQVSLLYMNRKQRVSLAISNPQYQTYIPPRPLALPMFMIT